jgi:hypothetical protein
MGAVGEGEGEGEVEATEAMEEEGEQEEDEEEEEDRAALKAAIEKLCTYGRTRARMCIHAHPFEACPAVIVPVKVQPTPRFVASVNLASFAREGMGPGGLSWTQAQAQAETPTDSWTQARAKVETSAEDKHSCIWSGQHHTHTFVHTRTHTRAHTNRNIHKHKTYMCTRARTHACI